MFTEPLAFNPVPRLVSGQRYRAVILGAVFDFWVPYVLNRKEARQSALEFAGPEIYDAVDIDSVRKLK